MTDRYERIREALALLCSGDYCERATGHSKLRNACDPNTIRELLGERDALEAENERLREQLRLATVDQAIAEAEASDAHAENKRLQESLAALEQEAGRG